MDLLQHHCSLCQSAKVVVLYRGHGISSQRLDQEESRCTGKIGAYGTIWHCTSCGLIFQDPTFSPKELANAYKESTDREYFTQQSVREALFRTSLLRLKQYKSPPGNLVDVGAGVGLFVHVAREFGWNAIGLEPSAWASKEAKKRFRVVVKQGTVEQCSLKPAVYDIITMWDVLEHFFDPLMILKKTHTMLKKDGIIALTTINIDSWFSKLLGPRWPWLIRIHLWYFTPETLRAMVEKAGFRIEWTGGQTRSFSLPYLIRRLIGKEYVWIPNIVVPAPTGDILFVIARKISSLD